ncbi:MAG: flagellar hook capping FlgD N-terminal domain-containing protein [Bacteroidota bacterium]|nr:flagellar hook capping FlgD N-terminal domain-containing protein [Bacteroidota bacterium]
MAQTLSPLTQQLFDALSPQRTEKQPTKQLGKEDFLKLLTLQLRSQNPLNPASNQEMAAQLAQFSALEQMQNISATLDKLLQSNATLALSLAQYSAPALIGRTAVLGTSQFAFDGNTSVMLGYELPSAATKAMVEIRSADGAVVRVIEVPASALRQGVNAVEWDGKDARGNRVPAGTYSFVVRATDNKDAPISAVPRVEGTITGIRYTDAGLVLVLGSIEVPIGTLVELR